MAWQRIQDAPMAGLATGIIHDGDGHMAVLVQADHVQVVIVDVASAREFAEGILCMLPIIESGVIPESMQGVDVANDNMREMETSVTTNRQALGLGEQQTS